MAYNNLYPGYNMYTQQQPQSGGLISVRSVEEAYNYPVAPGNSITFKDETQPFVYTKTKGFSPLEQPVFEKYRLVKVEDMPTQRVESPTDGFDAPGQIKQLWGEVNALKEAIKEAHDGKSADDRAVSAVHAKPGAAHGKNGHTAKLTK